MAKINASKRVASSSKTLSLTSPAKSRNARRAALAAVTPVVVDTPVSPVVALDAKRSDAAKRAAETRRANAAKRAEAKERAEKAARLSEIAKRAAATRAANRENGIAPRSASIEPKLSPHLAAVKANMTRTIAKYEATTDIEEKASLLAKIAKYEDQLSGIDRSPSPQVAAMLSDAEIEVKKVHWFMRFFSFL